MKMELSVIIVNYNGIKYLKECLDSLYDKLKNTSFEIIVIDNNSEDESCSYIKKNYPNVLLIESKENLGFGRGNNLGVKFAKGEIILLLNNDTVLLDSIEPAIEILTKNENLGILTIKMLDENKQYVLSVGKFPSPLKMLKFSLFNERRLEFISGKFDSNKIYYVDWVTGSFMLMRKKDYDTVQGFDPDYFLYVEDVDFCKRMTDAGKKCIFIPSLSFIHFVGFNKTREHFLIKGYQIYARKHFYGFSRAIANGMLAMNKSIKKFR
jgi:GT2 family glycosyltransferase